MTALAMVSFAASTPSTRLPDAVSACEKAGAAFSTFQPLTAASCSMVMLPDAVSGSSTSWAPLASSTALLSTSVPPSIMMILG
jgi:hypothetical protein